MTSTLNARVPHLTSHGSLESPCQPSMPPPWAVAGLYLLAGGSPVWAGSTPRGRPTISVSGGLKC